MAEINNGGRQHKHSVRRHSVKVDLTPMVDLGFLLITFFMLTTTMKRDYLMDLKMPVTGPAIKVPATKAMTVILAGDDKYYYFMGQDNSKIDTAYSSRTMKEVLQKQNKPVLDSIARFSQLHVRKQLTDTLYYQEVKRISKEPWALIVQVKANDKTQCQQLISLMDVLGKASVSKYALADLQLGEERFK